MGLAGWSRSPGLAAGTRNTASRRAGVPPARPFPMDRPAAVTATWRMPAMP
jgi:hypothetical protein